MTFLGLDVAHVSVWVPPGGEGGSVNTFLRKYKYQGIGTRHTSSQIS